VKKRKKMLEKKLTGLLVVGMIVMAMIAMTVPASANTRVYASDVKIINWFHVGLVYDVPIETTKNAYISGVDQATLNRYAPEHSNVQGWERRSYGSRKSVILVPKRYVAHRWRFASEIYLEFLP
jgi:hypothetical protein